MVALTGATGLLGKHILSRFHAEGVEMMATCRAGSETNLPANVNKKIADILDPVSLAEAFNGVDTVIHGAAMVSFNPRRHNRILEANVQGTGNVVNACLQAGVKNLIHISSVAALGRRPGVLTDENSTWISPGPSGYAESKYLAELEAYRGAEEGLTVSIVNPSVILAGSLSAHSSTALLDYVWREKKFYTEGILNYVDMRDVCEAVYKLYRKPAPGEKFILSAGSISFAEFFSRVATLLKRKKPSIKVPASLALWVGWMEEMRSLILNREPLVTRLSVKLAMQTYEYNHQKAVNELGIRFHSLEETLSWCCEEYLRNVKTNNQEMQVAVPV